MLLTTLLSLALSCSPFVPAPADPPAQEARLVQAEALRAEGSYAQALTLLEQAAAVPGASADRALALALADTRWRAALLLPDAQRPTPIQRAQRELEALIEAVERPEAQDALWALAQESLGDLHFHYFVGNAWTEGWEAYRAALAYWGRSADLEVARRHYLDIVFRAAQPPHRRGSWNPIEVHGFDQGTLEGAARIARSADDRARAQFLLGLGYARTTYDLNSIPQAIEAFEQVLAVGRASEWYDDGLFELAQFLNRTGRVVQENGSRLARPDLVGAVELYRRLLREFEPGTSRYLDQATNALASLTEPILELGVDRFFLPRSEVVYDLQWKNLGRIELALYPTDLTSGSTFEGAQAALGDWLARVKTDRSEARWKSTHAPGDPGDHRSRHERLVLPESLPPGAYVLEALAGQLAKRALVLVSDLTLVTKAGGNGLLVWAVDVETGAPRAGVELRLWRRRHENGQWRLFEARGTTAQDGIALFEPQGGERTGEFFLAAKSGTSQAFAQHRLPYETRRDLNWRLYAFSDRPAYRPASTVNFKAYVRERTPSGYENPAAAKVTWEVLGPNGEVVGKGEGELNTFGALAGTVETKVEHTLGQYNLQVRFAGGKRLVTTPLYRLEEYKLPEFAVTVRPAEEPAGTPKLFLLGDRVEVEVDARYYFGAPVAGATVEVYVHQKPSTWFWPIHRKYPWLHTSPRPDYWWGPGQQVAHEVLATDDEGRARFTFETRFELGSGAEYTIQARVVDAARREVLGTGSVRVMPELYQAHVDVRHAIHRPGAPVELEVSARDANDNPVAAEGEVIVLRELETEVWRSPDGRRVLGDELAQWRNRAFPPGPGWVRLRPGVEPEVLERRKLSLGTDGKASWSVRPTKDGLYRVVWQSEDARGNAVQAQAHFYVADGKTRRAGALTGGIDLILDEDTVEPGGEAAVLLVADGSDRWVLFTVEGEDLREHRVVHLEESARLVRLPILEADVPNLYLSAHMLHGGEVFTDMEELVVPPTKQFLEVEVEHAEAVVEPGSKGALAVRVTDHLGQPVTADLSVAVIDEALAYVQGDFAQDPREFFYSERRQLGVLTGGTYLHNRFVRLTRDEAGAVRSAGGERYAMGGEDDVMEEVDEMREGYLGQRAGALGAAPMAETASRSALGLAADEDGGANRQQEVRVRSDFRETALWVASVSTDADGRARFEVPFPDSTTRWATKVRSADRGSRFGQGVSSVTARLPLLARLQTPRFLVVGDEVTLTGNLSNVTDAALAVRAALTVEGVTLLGVLVDGRLVEGRHELELTVPARGEASVEWRVRVERPGEALLRLAALGEEVADAMERRIPIEDHGIEVQESVAGKFDAPELRFQVELPAARDAAGTRFDVQVTPSVAVTMLDALPYLIDYPYGCNEQTLSRFLPCLIVADTLRRRGLAVEDALARTFGGIEGEHADRTQARGKRPLEELDAMVARGLERLAGAQNGDGSFGWWAGSSRGDAHISAYVLWGLSLARDTGVDVGKIDLAGLARWIAKELVEAEEQPELAAWMLHAYAVWGGDPGDTTSDGQRDRALERLWRQRDGLGAQGRALFALAVHALGREEEARTLVANLANGVVLDERPDASVVTGAAGSGAPWVQASAHWGQTRNYRHWWQGGVESTAFALRALVAIEPENALVEPVVQWLVRNRRGAQWSNTRDTAITVLALNDWLDHSGELGKPVAFEVLVNGQPVGARSLTANEILGAPTSFRVPVGLLRDGANEVHVRRTEGDSPLYFAAYARFFSREEPVRARGSELFVRRDYYRLVGRPTLLAGFVYERVPLRDGETVKSGERVEVVLSIDAKNDLEYLLFEDLKPAGFEAVEVRSGWGLMASELLEAEARLRFGPDGEPARAGVGRDPLDRASPALGTTGRSVSLYRELRDRKVALFADRLGQGVWEIRYELRAETPGTFHALPVMGSAMYVPEIRGNGTEVRIEVE